MIQLPIDLYIEEILQKIATDQPVILTATPGSGKTTRVPAQLLIALRSQNIKKKIIVVVPKRLAAVAACDRIASENNWVSGVDVGYQVRFESLSTPNTQLIFMTEGFFLKKIQDSIFWNDVGTLILDEFHERSEKIDLILGLSFERKILKSDLQIVIMSATLNTEKLKSYFGEFNFIEVHAPPYQLQTIYQKTSQLLNCDHKFYDHLKKITLEAFKVSKKDILIFLPGFREILKAKNALLPIFPTVQIEYVYGGMTLSEQKRVLNKSGLARRIILATNIAESSLTVPELDCVIDCGLEKTVIREKKMGFTKLETLRISKFSATQRAGRAARTGDGICYRLWHEIDERSLPEQKKPEILNNDLCDSLLQLADFGIVDFENFSWLDKPTAMQFSDAILKLKNWALLNSENLITDKGQNISKIPLDLTDAVLFYELCYEGFKDPACQLFSKLETTDLAKRQKFNPYDLSTDLDYLFQLQPTEQQQKIYSQLLKMTKTWPDKNASTNLSFELTLLEIFAKYFSHRVCIKKANADGLSASGRGFDIAETSCLLSEKVPNDYIVALAGYEKSQAKTVINLGLGYSKSLAHDVLKKYLVTEKRIEFKSDGQKFIKKTIQRFGEFIFNESSPETLSADELAKNWKTFVTNDPSGFLRLNPSFEILMIKINFLRLKSDVLKLNDASFSFIETFEQDLVHEIIAVVDSFSEFLNVDFLFYIQGLAPEQIGAFIAELPNHIQLPTGRSVSINYTDPKAPLISAKIQDCFLWKTTPKILSNLLPLTIELLAPNMRPAQITNDLNTFWKNSYKDVRKDLRARYPKHSWPEEV